MRTPLATLTLAALLSLTGIASADIVKCTLPDGTTVYQNTPCGGTQTPLMPDTTQTQRDLAPAPRFPDMQPMQDAVQCAQLGEFAANVARARDHGASRYRLITPINRVAKTEAVRRLFTTMVDTIYMNTWLSPREARAMAQTSCLASGR